MIQIYLDHNVIQDLKKHENKGLLDKVLAAKEYVVFVFSTAHLQDLNRDLTEEKYADMAFMEQIVENHCYFYDKGIRLNYITPFEYYNDHEWPHPDLKTGMEDLFDSSVGDLLKAIPLNFNEIIEKSKEVSGENTLHSPEDLHIISHPPQLTEKLLTQSQTLFDFFENMLTLTTQLNVNQSEFKEHLKYFHAYSELEKAYEIIGIQGFNGLEITDKPLFWKSYTAKFVHGNETKSLYQLYRDMYSGLELFGLVKGKPKKQKMMGMINDSEHSFFGTACDYIVSKDEDFLNKTRFMYPLYEAETKIIHISELSNVLDKLALEVRFTLADLVKNIALLNEAKQPDHTEKTEAGDISCIALKSSYFAYFDIVCSTRNSDGIYYEFSKKTTQFSEGTLVKQVEYVTNRLIEELGEDHYGKGKFDIVEITGEKAWDGRTWLDNHFLIQLSLNSKIGLNIYPKDYLTAHYKPESK